MTTKSSPAKLKFVPGASRAPRSLTTLRAQMEDLARGERIRALRTDRRLTQPAVVELLRQKAGAQVVTLRGYQAWEGGGGIRWDNAKVLAEVFDVDPEYVMSGRGEQTATPDLFADPEEDRLARIERLLEEMRAERDEHAQRVEELLQEQGELLATIKGLLGMEGEPTLQDRLVQMLRDAQAKAGPGPGPRQPAPQDRS